MKKTVDMTKGQIIPLLVRFAVPLFIGNLFNQIYNIMDVAVAGRNLGEMGLAAIGATSSVYSLLMDFGFGMNSGCAIEVSRNFGAKQFKEVRQAIASAVLIDLVLSVCITGAGVIFLDGFITWMHTPASIAEDAATYLRIIIIGSGISVFSGLFAGILRAVGNTTVPLFVTVASCIVNIGLDMTIVPAYHLGIAGVAWTTVIGQALAMILNGLYFLRTYPEFVPKGDEWQPARARVLKVLEMGFSMAAMYAVVDVGNILYQSSNNTLGEIYITAESIATRISGVLMGPIGTLASAASTFVGQNAGAGEMNRVREGMRKAFVLEIIWGIMACVIAMAVGKPLIRFMSGADDSVLTGLAYRCLIWCMPFFPVLGVLCALRTSMQALESKIAPIASSVIEVLLRGMTGFVLIPEFGYLGTCIGVPITWCGMTLFLVSVYLIQRRVLFEESRVPEPA